MLDDIHRFRSQFSALSHTIYVNTGTAGPSPEVVISLQEDAMHRHNNIGPAVFSVLADQRAELEHCRAATAVVPEPANGSRTTSPCLEYASISGNSASTGFCVGCSLFPV